MMNRLVAVLSTLALAAPAFANDNVPAPPQTRPVALVGGTVYPVSGEPVENATILFADGEIVAVGPRDSVDVPDDAETIDVTGKRVYPGLFDAASQIGLVEIGAVRATRDENEAGSVNPNAQARVSVNPDSELIPTVRANGVLLSAVMPTGGLVSGQAAAMMLDGWTFEDMTLAPAVGVRMNWPRMLPRVSFRVEQSPEEQVKQRDEQLRALEDIFDQAERYRLAVEAAGVTTAATRPVEQPVASTKPAADVPDYDARLEAMVPLLTGAMPIIVSADEASQIEAAVAFAARRNLKLVILGGAEAGRVIPLLKKHDVAVILEGTHRLPTGRDEPVDEPFTLPARLHEAGVRFAVASNREPAFARNLPHHLGTAVGHGLPESEAIRAMTLAPADIHGVAGRVGSLEEGKDATIIVADGDILDITTHVTHAYIQGRPVDLTSKHTRLYEKYKRRYGQEL